VQINWCSCTYKTAVTTEYWQSHLVTAWQLSYRLICWSKTFLLTIKTIFWSNQGQHMNSNAKRHLFNLKTQIHSGIHHKLDGFFWITTITINATSSIYCLKGKIVQLTVYIEIVQLQVTVTAYLLWYFAVN